MILKKIFSSFPIFELLARRIIYSKVFICLHKLYKSTSAQKSTKSNKKKCAAKKIDPNLFFKEINKLGIKHGDILIVHSSYENLKSLSLTPVEIIDYLKDLVGPSGTLVLPAFRVSVKKGDFHMVDLDSKQVSTGMLPSLFVRMKGVIHGKFPVNTLSAFGKYAKIMFSDEINAKFVHGENTAWDFCVNNNAKILMLGTDPSRTLTAIHCAEDKMGLKWPIKGWFEKVSYKCTSNSALLNFNVFVRKRTWAKYMVSEYRTKVLIREKLLISNLVGNIQVSYVGDSKKLVQFIIDGVNTKNKKNMFFWVSKRRIN